jgi:hypothetical protein
MALKEILLPCAFSAKNLCSFHLFRLVTLARVDRQAYFSEPKSSPDLRSDMSGSAQLACGVPPGRTKTRRSVVRHPARVCDDGFTWD